MIIFTPLQVCSDHGVVNGLEWARDNEGEAVEIAMDEIKTPCVSWGSLEKENL